MDVIESIQSKNIESEKIINNFNTLNKSIKVKNEIIFYINIRSLNVNQNTVHGYCFLFLLGARGAIKESL